PRLTLGLNDRQLVPIYMPTSRMKSRDFSINQLSTPNYISAVTEVEKLPGVLPKISSGLLESILSGKFPILLLGVGLLLLILSKVLKRSSSLSLGVGFRLVT